MTKIIQQQSSREAIGEQFVYLPNLAVYPNYSDMNELYAMNNERRRKNEN